MVFPVLYHSHTVLPIGSPSLLSIQGITESFRIKLSITERYFLKFHAHNTNLDIKASIASNEICQRHNSSSDSTPFQRNSGSF